MPLYDVRWAGTPCAAVRDGKYKLIEYFGDWFDLDNDAEYRTGNRLELYDLAQDIGERDNLASRQPQLAARMRDSLHRWIESCGAVVPGPNPHYDPARALEEITNKNLRPV